MEFLPGSFPSRANTHMSFQGLEVPINGISNFGFFPSFSIHVEHKNQASQHWIRKMLTGNGIHDWSTCSSILSSMFYLEHS